MARGSQQSHYTSTAECIVALCWSAYVYDFPIGIMETHRLVIFRCAFFSGTNLAYSRLAFGKNSDQSVCPIVTEPVTVHWTIRTKSRLG